MMSVFVTLASIGNVSSARRIAHAPLRYFGMYWRVAGARLLAPWLAMGGSGSSCGCATWPGLGGIGMPFAVQYSFNLSSSFLQIPSPGVSNRALTGYLCRSSG